MSSTHKLTVGSDPEIILRDSNGELASAEGLLGGSKSQPRITNNGAIQEDGIAAELNPLPATSLLSFISNHKLVLGDLKEILEPLDLHVDISPSATFTDSLLDSFQARESGCERDFNAWKVSVNPIVSLEDTNLRAFGGHLHIGFERAKTDKMSRLAFVKALDMELAVPFTLYDDDKERRTLYGKAGAHRPKFLNKDGYDGVEYRVLSNFWLNSESMMSFVYSKIEYVSNNIDFLSGKADSLKDEIISIINTVDKTRAKAFCKDNGVSYAL